MDLGWSQVAKLRNSMIVCEEDLLVGDQYISVEKVYTVRYSICRAWVTISIYMILTYMYWYMYVDAYTYCIFTCLYCMWVLGRFIRLLWPHFISRVFSPIFAFTSAAVT